MRKYNLRKYGLTIEQYDRMLEEQKGLCYLCSTNIARTNGNKNLGVDHCHKTGKVRKLLCAKCNTGLGVFNDNVELMQKAIAYVKNYQ